MSLRVFHLVFVVICILMALFVAGWGVRDYLQTGSGPHLALGVGFFAGGVLLVAYSGWFVRKIKAIGSL